ncbi:hypothetical protein LOH54_05335 [Sulfurimonas sp. HSL-3221]|uniref:Uncharacterized protein n=1 Tax=Sulfurimonas diazotrophicus TaxID=3131939 RepID=A0ABZ3HCU2_9BACT|nr:hypothetical protein [Sulfurimonas sp. HSL-3221]UFS63554.1 hypothetical protein LOH54_05335 [Sulfurimonas sp. HSL-3221]
MTKILRFKTAAGIFHVARDGGGRYHILFNDESMGDYGDMIDAIEGFVHESGFYIIHPEMAYPLDTFDLGIPDDISGWEPC